MAMETTWAPTRLAKPSLQRQGNAAVEASVSAGLRWGWGKENGGRDWFLLFEKGVFSRGESGSWSPSWEFICLRASSATGMAALLMFAPSCGCIGGA